MTTDELRRQLDRIADAAPAADVPHDTWTRARRATLRDRVLVGVAAAVVAVGVASAVTWLPDASSPQVAGSDVVGAPSTIWNVPGHVADAGDLEYSGHVETDFAVGRGAVAFIATNGVPVVVGAGDGAYHLLALPGLDGRSLAMDMIDSGATITLSPDGTQLAYPYLDPDARASAASPMPAGVRVVDLDTGEIREIALQGGQGVMVHDLAWSPSGTWLVWAGRATDHWETNGGYGAGAGSERAGRVASGSSTSEPVLTSTDSASRYAISDKGEVALAVTDKLRREGDGGSSVTPYQDENGESQPIDAAFVDRDVQVVRQTYEPTSYRLVSFDAIDPAVSLGSVLLGGADDRIQPLGWLDGEHLLARTGKGDDEGFVLDRLSIIDVRTNELEVVGAVEAGVPTISVATDLVTVQHPTVERPEPDWPFDWTTPWLSALIGLGVAAAIAVLMGLRWGWRRYRSAR